MQCGGGGGCGRPGGPLRARWRERGAANLPDYNGTVARGVLCLCIMLVNGCVISFFLFDKTEVVVVVYKILSG